MALTRDGVKSVRSVRVDSVEASRRAKVKTPGSRIKMAVLPLSE